MAKALVFEGEFNGVKGFGVERDGAIVYEADFASRKVAARVAELESRVNPPEDWHKTEKILLREGFKKKDLAVIKLPARQRRRRR